MEKSDKNYSKHFWALRFYSIYLTRTKTGKNALVLHHSATHKYSYYISSLVESLPPVLAQLSPTVKIKLANFTIHAPRDYSSYIAYNNIQLDIVRFNEKSAR